MELHTKASKQSLKDHNTRLVFQTIYNEGAITRVGVAEITTLTRTTVAEVVKQLAKKEKLVKDIGKAQATIGRTPTLVSIVKDARHIIAVDLSSNTLRGALINLRGEIKQRRNSELGSRSEEGVLLQISQLIKDLKDASKKIPLLGIGLSITGLVNPDTGVLQRSTILNLHNVHLKDRLERRYKLPVYVMNDGQALALGEYTLSQRKPVTNLIVIRTGVGIGGGLVLNGELFNGDGYGAGELGHIVVADAEERIQCNCGNFGCLTTVASPEKIIERAQKRACQDPTSTLYGVSPLSLERIGQDAQAKDSVALQVIEETGRYFGRAIGNLVGILNVHHITVSGDIKALGDPLRKAMIDEMGKYCLKDLAENTTIDVVKADPDKILLGAATQLLTHEFGITRFVPDHTQPAAIPAHNL